MGAEADLPAERALTPTVARENALVPAWLRRMTALGWRVLVIVAFGAVCVRLALMLSTVTMAILVGGVVGATVLPIVRHLRVDRSWPAGRAAGLASLAALAVVIAIVLLIVIAFVPYVGNVIDATKVGVDEVLRRLTELGAPAARPRLPARASPAASRAGSPTRSASSPAQSGPSSRS